MGNKLERIRVLERDMADVKDEVSRLESETQFRESYLPFYSPMEPPKLCSVKEAIELILNHLGLEMVKQSLVANGVVLRKKEPIMKGGE